MKKTYKIEVDCINCAQKMEDAAKATAGVEFEDSADENAVMDEVIKACKKVESDCEIFR